MRPHSLNYDHGMVLFSSLVILALLMALGIGIYFAVQNNHRISANLRLGSVAFYLAESGIEWSKDRIRSIPAHPPDPVEGTENLASGKFSVYTVSTTEISPLTGGSLVRSTGSFGVSSQTVEALITKTYDLSDAAIALRGGAGGVALNGDSFFVSAMDHDPATRQVVPGEKARSPISVADEAARLRIDQGLTDLQRANLVGQNAGPVGAGDHLPGGDMARLANDVCSVPSAIIVTIPDDGLLFVGNEAWGNPSAPQIRCITGLPSAGDAVAVTGAVTGAGILVVRDADLALNGPFHWEGLIVLSGSNGRFRTSGDPVKEIFGAVLINETTAYSEASPPSLELQGAVRVFFSRAALATAARLTPLSTLSALRPGLPSEITQKYWRAMTD
ncbi:MAG TPA: pilus assembly PilX N-terminal domain-containing protein [candidate division Zixibacteria bacterium]|nr:pilus assembly PilX N-terminal domain-containing protein [candidate division Zixibacteria bacterium]